MTKKGIFLTVLAGTLGVGALALAVPGRGGPGDHRGPGQHDRHRGDRGPGMFGRFLENPRVVEKLGLSEDQIEQLSNLKYEAMKQHIRLKAIVSEAKLEVRHLLGQDVPDQSAVMAAIEQAGKASVDLRKSDVSHMLKGRSILGPDKWKEIRQMMAHWRHGRKGEPRGMRGRHGGGPGGDHDRGRHGSSGPRPDGPPPE